MTRLFLAGWLVACHSPEAPEPLVGGDTCVALVDGPWTLGGPAWGMGDLTMLGTVTMDTAECSFRLDDYDMAMNDLPSGGVVDEDRVQLDGLTSYWRTCVGTADEEAHVSGTCSEDGSAFEMTAGGT